MHIQTSLPPGFETGAFTCVEALASGISAKRLRSRDIEHPFWGICVAAGSVQNLQDRCRAFQHRMPAGAFFSHATAARLYGVPLPENLEADPLIHVTVVEPDRAPRAAGVIGHHVANPSGVSRVAGMPVLALNPGGKRSYDCFY